MVWGLLNAIYFLPLLLLKQNRKNMGTVAAGKILPSLREFLSMSMTFLLTVFAWIFFRAESLTHAFSYISGIFSWALFTVPNLNINNNEKILGLVFILHFIIFIVLEWVQRHRYHGFAIGEVRIQIRWLAYLFFIMSILLFNGQNKEFIYFQF